MVEMEVSKGQHVAVQSWKANWCALVEDGTYDRVAAEPLVGVMVEQRPDSVVEPLCNGEVVVLMGVGDSAQKPCPLCTWILSR